MGCIWKVAEEDRHCEFCSYRGGCEKYIVHGPTDERLKQDIERYSKIMVDIAGVDIIQRSRDRAVVWARNIVFYKLRADGYSLQRIGRFMNYSHCIVLYGSRRVEEMLQYPSMYSEEISLWNKFQKFIK